MCVQAVIREQLHWKISRRFILKHIKLNKLNKKMKEVLICDLSFYILQIRLY